MLVPRAHHRSPVRRAVRTACIGAVAVLALAGCSGDDAEAPTDLSAEALVGFEVLGSEGCAGCHGRSGQGGVGPSLVGIVGAPVELTDGTEVIVDEDYLRRSIVDPSAQTLSGYTIPMPKVDLTDAEVDALIAYILELS